jgi:hypothetical protein
MSFIDPSRDIQKPTLDQANYEGFVIDNNDPEKRQRVRVRIPVLHRDIPDDKLPWSHINSSSMANAGSGVGSVNVADKYSKVNVVFHEDDPHNPRYGSSPTTDDVHKDNELLQSDYPNSYGHVDSHGNKWTTNKATGDVSFVHKSGATIVVDGGGNVTIGGAGNVNIASKGNLNLAAAGNLNLHAGGMVDIAGGRIDLNTNGASSPVVPGSRTRPSIASKANQTQM